ncbi:MAG TPA: hypothetical protein VHC97_24670 [Thermoanaerobaculia bacterium]|jgi:hypothetical protein|nr:hypothetical protein [Thermoanaerobaculia bacterium]
MWRRIAPLSILALTLFTAPRLEAQWTLDPQPDYLEFHAEPAARADGSVLLTWTRQLEAGAPFSVLAAPLDPVSGQVGEFHEWGEGQAEQTVALANGYLAVRQTFTGLQEWIVERLDASGQVTGAPLSLERMFTASAHSVPGGGAVVVGGGVGGTGGTVQAWKFGPDGALLTGPVTLAESSLEAAAGVDAAGNLVLAWTDSGTRVFAQRFSPDLQPLGPVEPVALGGALGIRVAVAPDGRFVVVYDQRGRLWSRPFRADGSPAGPRRTLSPPKESVDREDLDVALGPDGRILVVWKVYAETSGPTLRARVLSLAGRPEGGLLRLAQVRVGRGDLLWPRVESLPVGDFLVVWTRADAARQVLTLQGRRFR